MLFKSSASPKENPGSKRLRRALGLLLGSALAVQYKQDRVFRASVNLQLVMVLNYLYAAYNLLIGLQSGSVWLLSLGIYTLMLAIVRTDLTLSHHRGRKLPPDAPHCVFTPSLTMRAAKVCVQMTVSYPLPAMKPQSFSAPCVR